MSEKNFELIRQIYARLTAGDPELAELLAPDVVIDFSRRLVDPFVLRGRAELRATLEREDMRREWADWPTWEPEELLPAGDKVLAFIRFGGRGKASGIEIAVHVANLWTFHDGVPVALKYLGEDRSAALEAAGLDC